MLLKNSYLIAFNLYFTLCFSNHDCYYSYSINMYNLLKVLRSPFTYFILEWTLTVWYLEKLIFWWSPIHLILDEVTASPLDNTLFHLYFNVGSSYLYQYFYLELVKMAVMCCDLSLILTCSVDLTKRLYNRQKLAFCIKSHQKKYPRTPLQI